MSYRLPKVGDKVNVIEKRNYENGQLTTGIVQRLLSNPHEPHPRGNKVELKDGTVGRMVSFVDEVGEQALVDPEEREAYREEIRSLRGNDNSSRHHLRDVQSKPEPVVRAEDILTDEDLR